MEDVLSLLRMVTMPFLVDMLHALNMNMKGKKIWEEGKAGFNSSLSMVHIASKKARLDYAGYVVLRGMENHQISTNARHFELWKPEDFPNMTAKDFCDLLMLAFLEEMNQTWNLFKRGEFQYSTQQGKW